eukprot:TRINITY_DN2594_c0_g1_i1.p1 TRINITY_DN2594_c0_g1~~TRINITY_DN2594_c0_g1_i1.p1  ORF type:complete len:225 (-),score=62.51 TRINITY_DN2594_c0_g1_i1:56-730(-)
MSGSTATKKVSLGNVDSIVKDIGVLYGFFLDHSLFLDTETRNFLKEFEGKRGDRDILALKGNCEAMKLCGDMVDRCKGAAEADLLFIKTTIDGIKDNIKTLPEKEKFYQDMREVVRRGNIPLEEGEKRKFLSQQKQTIASLDQTYQEQLNLLKQKFTITVIPQTATTPPTSPRKESVVQKISEESQISTTIEKENKPEELTTTTQVSESSSESSETTAETTSTV